MDIGGDKMFKLDDEKIIFNSNFNFENLECIGCGGNSTVYKLKVCDEYYSLKIFDNPNYWSLKDFKKKLELNIPSFISPIKISYLNNKFNGYLMKLCKGSNLKERSLEVSIQDFIRSSDKLFCDTLMLSESKYLMQDIKKSNVMFDNGFKVIDMDFYIYCDGWFLNDLIKDKSSIIKYNQKCVTQMLIDVFVWNSGIKKLFEQSNELEKLKNDCIIGKISLNYFLSILCGLVCCDEEYQNIKIQDIGKRLIRSRK